MALTSRRGGGCTSCTTVRAASHLEIWLGSGEDFQCPVMTSMAVLVRHWTRLRKVSACGMLQKLEDTPVIYECVRRSR